MMHISRSTRIGVAAAAAVAAALLALGVVTEAGTPAEMTTQPTYVTSTTSTAEQVPVQGTGAAATVTLCPMGLLPHLDIARFPQSASGGAISPEAAVADLTGATASISVPRFGQRQGAPGWAIVAGRTYFVTVLADGTWFASAARLVECGLPQGPRPLVPPVSGAVG